MASPFKGLYDLHSGGGAGVFELLQIYCLYVLIKAIKHHYTKNLLNYKVLPRPFRTRTYFFKFLLFKLLKL